MQQPRALRQPAASKLARPVSLNSDARAQQNSSVIAAEDPVDRNSIPKSSNDASGSPSRLPAPRRLHGDGCGIGGAKRRSMLPQLSPTKGLAAVLEAGKREHGRINEEADGLYNERISLALGNRNAADNTKNPSLLGFTICQSNKTDPSSNNSSNPTRINTGSETTSRQDTTMKQSEMAADLLPTEDSISKSRNPPLTRTLSTAAVLTSEPASSETRVIGSREIIVRPATSDQARPIRRPTTYLAATPSTSAPRDPNNKPGFSIPTGMGAATARPRSMVLNTGREFALENRPGSSTSASSTEHALSKKSDAKRQHPTNVSHRRTPSARSARTAFSGKPKELERKEIMPPPGNALASTRGVNVAVAEQKKPAFSTLQQHFTPKKALKVPTSFNLTTAGKQPNSELISAETARSQTELLQLHILHQSSTKVSHAWRQSAETKLRKRFEDVAQRYRKMAVLERKTQAQLNLCALKEFAHEGGAGQVLGERIQVLGSVIPEIVNATGAGGKYIRLARGFERWIEWVEQIWEARDCDGKAFNSRGELEFVECLGDGWRDEITSLSRKLGLWLQDLDNMGSSPAGSSLALVVAHCRCLTEGMLQELEMMRGMECEIVARESRWVSEIAAELSAEETVEADSALTEEGRTSASKQGIWRIP
ncbi:hypothetical protein FGG08_004740 [Glutinoglossum americanum]|uniref:Uncharacterized protein n=1 Tax=Glutinoglossum americanum TaxID=1670608 RepID=A0A9P8KWQ5_9PEZI|nr:hypothetical protein FGG08_004740 [Glutinoglossum americanum]